MPEYTTRDKQRTVETITHNHIKKFVLVRFTDGYEDEYIYSSEFPLFRYPDKISNKDIVKI